MSSAKLAMLSSSRNRKRSEKYILNRSGPRIDRWGTPIKRSKSSSTSSSSSSSSSGGGGSIYYLSHGKLKIKINKTFSNWANILYGVPQGFILGPLIFNVFLCDCFLFKPNIDLISYADDNNPFAMGGSSELEVIN